MLAGLRARELRQFFKIDCRLESTRNEAVLASVCSGEASHVCGFLEH